MSYNSGMTYRMPQSGHCPPDFKSPSEQSQLITSAPSNPKKRRKTSNTNALPPQPTPTPQDLLPPPLTGYGDTIVASNPFDDTPSISQPMNHMLMHSMNHMHNPMGGPPLRNMHPMSMVGMNQMGSPMGPMSHMSNRGGISPMPGMPNASIGGMSPIGSMGPNLSPMGPMGGMSPMGGQSSHIGINASIGPNSNRSIGSPMSGGPIGSPMNSMAMGSPMSSAMGSPLGGGPPHINNGQMGPPMHSPISNSPSQMQASRLNGALNSNGGAIAHQIPPHGVPNTTQISMSSNNMNQNSGAITSNSNMNVINLNHPNLLSQGGMQQVGTNNSNTNNNMMNSNMMGGMNIGPPHHMNPMSGNGPVNGPPSSMGMFGPKPMPISAGKVYPPGQPMVFNPQNPSAPPIYACGLCHKEVNDNDEALFCESGCNFFFHRACTGLTEAAFQLMSKEIYAEWCCDKCFTSKNIPLVKFKS